MHLVAISVFELKTTARGGKIKNAIHWGDRGMTNFQMKFSEYVLSIFKLSLVPTGRKRSREYFKTICACTPIWESYGALKKEEFFLARLITIEHKKNFTSNEVF